MKTASAGYTQQAMDTVPASHRWIKLIVAVWAVRMGMIGIGMIIPIFVGMIASVPRSRPLFIPDTIIAMQTWEHPTPEKTRWLFKGNVPVVMKGATLPQPHSYELLLQAWLPETLDLIKTSPSPYFTYFDSSAPWSTSLIQEGVAVTHNHNQSVPYTHTSMKTVTFLKAISSEPATATTTAEVAAEDVAAASLSDDSSASTSTSTSDVAKREYLYSTTALGVDRPSQSALLQSIAPYLALYDEHHADERRTESRASLWMASKDVYVAPHYDTDHNFLLQLSGTKRVVLTTPAGYDLFRPASALSPYWRQQQVQKDQEMNNMHNIKEAISQCYGQPLDSVDTDAIDTQTEIQTETQSSLSTPTALCFTGYNNSDALFHPTSIISWEVLLTPGDILYIPPGYFHSVLYTSTHSHSVNLWVNSLLSDVKSKLRNVVSLPYARVNEGEYDGKIKGETLVQMEVLQLAAVGSLCRGVFRNLFENYDAELKLWKRRYHSRYQMASRYSEDQERQRQRQEQEQEQQEPVFPPAIKPPAASVTSCIADVVTEGDVPATVCADSDDALTPVITLPTPTALTTSSEPLKKTISPNITAYQCSKELRVRADQTKKVKVTTEQVTAHLRQIADRTNSMEVSYVLFMDYTEELLHQIITTSRLATGGRDRSGAQSANKIEASSSSPVSVSVSVSAEIQVIRQFIDTCI